jgi:5'-3' exonuclease
VADPDALTDRDVQLHLVDATYELFRAHYAPRPPVIGRDGVVLSGVSGVCDQLLYLLREEGATHVGCATDRVIESFRNDLFPGYKSSAGMPRDLLDQFPIAEAAIEALGIVLWPEVEYEADDAIAAAAIRFADDPRVDKILICTPDKDMAQLVRDERVVLWDRRRGLTYDDAGVRTKWGVPPVSIPDWLAVVGDSSDGYPGIPGWGAKGAAAILSRYGHLEDVPPRASSWEVPGVSGGRAMTLAASLRDHWDEALLYRDLARLRTTDDGVQIRQRDPDELRWDGAPRDTWEAFCEEWGLDRLRSRPHRWLEA